MTLADDTVAKTSRHPEPADTNTETPVEAAEASPVAESPEASPETQPETVAEAAEAADSSELEPDGVVQDARGEEAEAADAEKAAEPQIELAVLEALLFSTHHPLTAGRLGELLDLGSVKPVRNAIKDLNKAYEETGRCFRVEQVAGGYQLLTLPEYGDILNKMHQREADTKLTKSALETLAIVAYKQPILRADVEAIRGVACGETIRSLMEKHLVKIAGRAELPGRPILYGTTKRFLELFGLNSLKDLPQQEEGLAKAKAKPEAKVETPAQAPEEGAAATETPPGASSETPAAPPAEASAESTAESPASGDEK